MTADIYTTPLLTARETARYLGMPESTLDRWLLPRGAAPLVHAVEPERRGWPRVPFVGVIEAYVLRALRDARMPLAAVDRAAELVREEFGDPYALARQRIATDGVDLFVRLADETSLVRAHDRQHAIPEVLHEHLRLIEWTSDGAPRRLHLRTFPEAADVIIDPRFGWGAPVLGAKKVRVADIVGLWKAGERIADVADEYDLDVGVVEDIIRAATPAAPAA
jgi:uncharacterized protein (DUF433 family)